MGPIGIMQSFSIVKWHNIEDFILKDQELNLLVLHLAGLMQTNQSPSLDDSLPCYKEKVWILYSSEDLCHFH